MGTTDLLYCSFSNTRPHHCTGRGLCWRLGAGRLWRCWWGRDECLRHLDIGNHKFRPSRERHYSRLGASRRSSAELRGIILPTSSAQSRTSTFTGDNAGNPDPVTVRSPGIRRVRVKVSGNTCAFNAYEPIVTSGPIAIDIGDYHDFTKIGGGFYEPGDVCGFVETVGVASATFSQHEMSI